MVNRIVLNETSYFGRNSRERIIDEINDRKYQRLLFVTDPGVVRSGVANKVLDLLNKHEKDYYVYDGIKANPTIDNVKDGLYIAKQNDIDCVIAVGGGSVIDTAKAIAIILANPEFEDVVSLDGVAETKNKSIPIIALPTTAGTAAEVTINYVITNEAQTKKMVCVDVHDIPVVAIIDPDLMESMPQQLAASTGMDALTHAMEGYTTRAAWLMSDMFHINSMALIYKNLEMAANKKDRVAVEKVAYAQYIAGMGFSNVGLGIVHSMAHSLGAFFDTPHGIANALMLPHVLRYNGKVCPELFKNMGHAFGLDLYNLSDDEVVEKVASAVESLSQRLGLPQRLRDIGIPEELLPTLAKQAFEDICTSGNIRKVTVEDLTQIYRNAY